MDVQGKKLPGDTDANEGFVTDEDEGAEPEKKRSSKRVRLSGERKQ